LAIDDNTARSRSAAELLAFVVSAMRAFVVPPAAATLFRSATVG
jgi:hypothetical protein